MKQAHLEITTDSTDFVMFHTSCSCSSPHHTLTIIVEKHSNSNSDIEMSLCFEVGSIERYNEKWYHNFLSRIKRACTVLFTGNIWMEGCFIFRSAEHAQEVINTLQEAVNQMKNKKDEC